MEYRQIRREHSIRLEHEHYPVTVLGEPGKEHPLPGIEGKIKIGDLPARENVILLGERSGGVRDCLLWCCQVLDGKNLRWAFVHGAQWKPALILTSTILTSTGEHERVANTIESIGSLEKASEKAEALISWADEMKSEVFYLLVRDFAALGNDQAHALADALRLIRDLDKCHNLRLIVGSDSESYFADDVFSGMLSMAFRYRVMPFSEGETAALCAEVRDGISLNPDPEALREIQRVTGGQPALVQDLLGRIRSLNCIEVGKKEVGRAFQIQRRSPPGVTRLWKAELRKLLAERRDLLEPMRRYAAGRSLGASRFPPPPNERPLMISGWLRLDQSSERWGISSEIHADLVRDVLESL